MDKFLSRFYPETAFGGFSRVDGTVAFYVRVDALLRPSFTVLDVGTGRGSFLQKPPEDLKRRLRLLKGKCHKVIGIDVDPVGSQNASLDEFRLIEGDHWPVNDASIDLCLSDYVLEHISHPDSYFAECARVLKPGGFLCLRTPNSWNYLIWFARLIPNRSHTAVLAKAQSSRDETDIFPTVYRCNTRRKLSAMMRRHGFDACVYMHEPEPGYLSFSKAAYFLGVLFQRHAPSPLYSTLLAFGRKKC